MRSNDNHLKNVWRKMECHQRWHQHRLYMDRSDFPSFCDQHFSVCSFGFACDTFQYCQHDMQMVSVVSFFFHSFFFFFWLYSVIAQIGNILIQIWTKEIVYAIDIMRYFGITRLKWKVNLIDALLPILFLNIFGENVLWVSFDSFVALKTAYFQRWQATLQNLNCS